jgi:hypothetical protein
MVRQSVEVRSESKTAVATFPQRVRFPPDSGWRVDIAPGRFRAISRWPRDGSSARKPGPPGLSRAQPSTFAAAQCRIAPRVPRKGTPGQDRIEGRLAAILTPDIASTSADEADEVIE